MNEQDQQAKLQSKRYQEDNPQILVAKEPETIYETQTNVGFEEEFNKAVATAITMDDLRHHLYTVIDRWPWQEK